MSKIFRVEVLLFLGRVIILRFMTVCLLISEFFIPNNIPTKSDNVLEDRNSNPGPAKSYTTLQTVRHCNK